MAVKVNVTGRHIQVTDDLKRYAQEKASRLDRYFDRMLTVEVVLTQDGGERKVAEMIVHPRKGERIVGTADHEDMFAAIDLVIDKMYQQLHRLKERVKDAKKHSGRVPPPSAPPEPDEDEGLESYEEVVDEFSKKFD